MEIAALIISLLALLISGLAVYYTRQQAIAQTHATDIETERRADEVAARDKRRQAESSAIMDVRFNEYLENEDPAILVSNRGLHVAEHVQLIFDASNDGLVSPVTEDWRNLPMNIGPSDTARINSGVSVQTTQDFRVILTWSDGRGQQQCAFRLRVA